jgi:hypothetical protein
MDSGAMIYIPTFIQTGSGVQKLIRRDSQTHRQQGDLISLLLFFQNEEIKLIVTTAIARCVKTKICVQKKLAL